MIIIIIISIIFFQMVSRFFEGEVWLCLLINVTGLVYAQLDGERCCKEGDGNTECGGQLKTVGKTLSRAGDFFCGLHWCARAAPLQGFAGGTKVFVAIILESVIIKLARHPRECWMPLGKRERATCLVQDGATCVNKTQIKSSSPQRIFEQVMRERCLA